MPEIQITEPKYNNDWFKYRANEALLVMESRRTPRFEGRKQFLNVLAGLFRHAYNKGRHDEKLEQKERSKATFNA